MTNFDNLLDDTLRSRTGEPPRGLEQRLLAHLANAPAALPGQAERTLAAATGMGTRPALFATADRVRSRRSALSSAFAVAAHAMAMVLIYAAAHRALSTHTSLVTHVDTMEFAPPPPPVSARADTAHGGGGQVGPTPVSQGHLPRPAAEQLLAPKVVPPEDAKLPVEPSTVLQPDLKMADNKLPDLGVPNATLHGFSMGNGRGSGVGSGDGSGVGPGSGSNAGSGLSHVGGAVRKPEVLYAVDPEFSEEARKSKFSGDVEVYLWVDEQGNPSHVRVIRGVGMGPGRESDRSGAAVQVQAGNPGWEAGEGGLVHLCRLPDFLRGECGEKRLRAR